MAVAEISEARSSPESQPKSGKNPYVGPKPFEPHESNLFFGRDWETRELVALISAHPVVLLYAQSGAGKSSLLNAKLLSTLERDENAEILPVARVRGDVPPGVEEAAIKNRYIFNTLMSWSELDDFTPAQLVDLTLAQFLQQLPRRGDEEGYPVLRLLVFDQFEELFTFYPDHWPEREDFFRQVSDALVADSYLRVLFVIREDFLAQVDAYADLLPEQLRARFRLERLTAEAALAAVEGPLKDTSRSFAPGVAQELVAELLKIRVEDQEGRMVERPGQFIEPVQLQVVCQNLWAALPPQVTQITADHLETFGDIDQALTGFYEKAIEDTVLKTGAIPLFSEWRLRNWFEQEALTPVGTRGLVYRGPRKTGTISNAEVDILESHHIIRGERRAGGRWYELTHDRFVDPIQKANTVWRIEMIKRWAMNIGGMALLIIIILFIFSTAQRWIAQLEADRAQAAEATAQAAATAQVVTQLEANATATAARATIEAGEQMSPTISETAQAEVAQAEQQTAEIRATSTAAAQTVRKDRVRPLRAGLSIGGPSATAGTLGYFVVDEEGQIYILSAADVLGTILGLPVLQPGPFDGGQIPQDVVGRLARLLPLSIPTVSAADLTALAQVNPDIGVESAVPSNGPVLGLRVPREGLRVRKLGRSTGWTSGEIIGVNQTRPIFLNGGMIQVRNLIVTSLEASGGDSGALVLDEMGYAIGILVTTSGRETLVAPLQPVLDRFDVHLLPPSIEIIDVSGTLPRHPTRQWPGRNPAEIGRIVLHHTATPANISVERLASAAVNDRNWPGISYHYCVTDQGVVYQTQPLDVAAFQSSRFSRESVDICLIGDFTDALPSRTQLNSTAVLLAQLVEELGLTVDEIYGSKELDPTESPGATWEQWRAELLDKVRGLIAGDITITIATPTPANGN